MSLSDVTNVRKLISEQRIPELLRLHSEGKLKLSVPKLATGIPKTPLEYSAYVGAKDVFETLKPLFPKETKAYLFAEKHKENFQEYFCQEPFELFLKTKYLSCQELENLENLENLFETDHKNLTAIDYHCESDFEKMRYFFNKQVPSISALTLFLERNFEKTLEILSETCLSNVLKIILPILWKNFSKIPIFLLSKFPEIIFTLDQDGHNFLEFFIEKISESRISEMFSLLHFFQQNSFDISSMITKGFLNSLIEKFDIDSWKFCNEFYTRNIAIFFENFDYEFLNEDTFLFLTNGTKQYLFSILEKRFHDHPALIFLYCKFGNLDLIGNYLIEYPDLLTILDDYENNLFHILVKENRPEIVSYLLQEYPEESSKLLQKTNSENVSPEDLMSRDLSNLQDFLDEDNEQ